MYNNQVLIGNWFEEQNGTFALQRDGNKESTYQNDFREHALPVRDNRSICKIREKAKVMEN